ncbi:MAG: VOC family protein [Thermodesulfobacteriota bacterium]
MIDHVGIRVSDFERSKRFYQAALAPLGYELMMEFDGAAGFGADGKPDFWIGPSLGASTSAIHVAITSADRRAVDAFYAAAIAAGGRDNGKPGVRAEYHPTYYGAFVLDPDGNNVEAVCHAAV